MIDSNQKKILELIEIGSIARHNSEYYLVGSFVEHELLASTFW